MRESHLTTVEKNTQEDNQCEWFALNKFEKVVCLFSIDIIHQIPNGFALKNVILLFRKLSQKEFFQ